MVDDFLLTQGVDSAGSTTYTTASIAPNAGRLLAVAVMVSGPAPSPDVTVTGCGVTWVKVVQNAGGTQPIHSRTLTLFRAMGTPTAGALTITAAAALTACMWQVVEFSGADTSGTNGSGAIVQFDAHRSTDIDADSDTSTFDNPVTAGNAAYGVVALHSVQEPITPGAGWTALAATLTVAAPQSSMLGMFGAPAPQAIAASWTSLTDDLMVGIEIKAASSSGGGDVIPPSVPASISATAASSSQVSLSWSASTDNVGVTSYRVRRDGVDLPGATAVTGTSFVDNTVKPSTTYQYTVSARDAAGNRSGESATATIAVPAASTQQMKWDGSVLVPLTVRMWNGTTLVTVGAEGGDKEPPSVPTGLTAVAANPTRVDLKWNTSTDNVGVDGYRVRRNGVVIATPTALTFSDTGVSPGTQYSYTVQAFDEAGNASNVSTAAVVTTPVITDTEKPSVPTGVDATADSDTTISVSWNPSTDNVGVSHYVVLRNGQMIAQRVTGTQYLAVGLSPNTTYSFTIQAVDTSGLISAESTPATATTEGTAPPPPPPPPGAFAMGFTAEQVRALPQSGAEWTRLLNQANGPYTHDAGNGNADGSGNALAGALVWLATGNTSFRTKVLTGIADVKSTADSAWQHAGLNRKIAAWALAGNIIGYTDPGWHAYLKKLLSFDTQTHNRTTPMSYAAWHWDNNHGAAAMQGYVAICAVLKIQNETIGGYPGGLQNAARWLRGFCGDRSSLGFGHINSTNPSYGNMGVTGEAQGKGWHMDESRPYGIGPSSIVWGSAVPLTRDGAVPSDVVRGNPYPNAQHPAVGVDGDHYVPGNAGRRTGAAMILAANGYPDVWTNSDYALYRWRANFERMYGTAKMTGNHQAYDPIVRKVYGRKFNCSAFSLNPASSQESLTGTDWLALIPSWPIRPASLA